MSSAFVSGIPKTHPAMRDPSKWYPHDYLMARTLIPLIPRWMTPNHWTVIRFFLTPLVLWFLVTRQYEIGIPLFFFTAFTDALDGSLARVRKQITDWGSFYDPVADKMLIGSVVLLVVMQFLSIYLALALVVVELVIVICAFFWKKSGRVTTANIYGKTKMFLQVLGVMLLLFSVAFAQPLLLNLSIIAFCLAIVFAVISLISYGI